MRISACFLHARVLSSCLQKPPLAHGSVSMLPARNSLSLPQALSLYSEGPPSKGVSAMSPEGGGGGAPPVRVFGSEGDLTLSEQGRVFLTLGPGARTEEVIHLRVELAAALAAAFRAREHLVIKGAAIATT